MFKVKVKISEYILLEEPTTITFLFHSESYSSSSPVTIFKIMHYINTVSVIEIFIVVKKAFLCLFVGYLSMY